MCKDKNFSTKTLSLQIIMTSMKSYPTTNTANGRIVFLDYLRVVACFMVIMVHSIEPFYLNSEGTYIATHSDAMWVTFLDSALRCAVPLFVMTSSYLLMPITTSTPTFYRRRIQRVVIPFILWSLLYAVVPMWGSGGSIDIAGNLSLLAVNFMPHSGHLWFIYMLIGLYLFMPIISPWLEQVSKQGERAFIALWLISTALPLFRELALIVRGTAEVWGEASWNEFGMLYYFSGFIGYVVVAHYIRKYINWNTTKTLAIAVPMFAVGYLLVSLPFYYQLPEQYPVSGTIDLAVAWERSWCFATTGVALTAIAIFLIFKLISKAHRGYGIIKRLSGLSYGIYLVHIFVLVTAYSTISPLMLSTPVTILLTAVSTFTVSALIALLLKLLPGSKYLIG